MRHVLVQPGIRDVCVGEMALLAFIVVANLVAKAAGALLGPVALGGLRSCLAQLLRPLAKSLVLHPGPLRIIGP